MSGEPTLLLVEDDCDSGLELAELLEVYGFASSVVATIADAQAVIAADLPDIAVIDASVGDGAGCALGRALIDLSGGQTRVVIVSGRMLSERERVILPESDTPFLLKPVDIGELLALIR